MALTLHNEWKYFLLTISWLVSLLSFVVCIFGTIKAQKHIHKNKMQTRLIILTLICMYTFTACNICDSIGFPFWSGLSQTENAYQHNLNSYLMWNVLWCIAKLFQYILYLTRLYSIFRGTKYETNTKIYFVIALLLIGQFITLIIWVYYYNIQWICCQIWADNQYQILTIIAWLILVIDLVLTSLIFIIFLLSMKKLLATVSKYVITTELSNTQQSNDGNTENKETAETAENVENVENGWSDREKKLLNTTTRLFVLSSFSLLSSIFYQIVFGIAIIEEFTGTDIHNALYYFSFTWGIDNAINVICLFLSFSFSKAYYYKLCKCDICCLKLIQKLIIK